MLIDHIGVVVKSIERGITHWEKMFGYTQYTEIVENTKQKVRVVFMTKADSTTIKLVQPSEESSPVYTFARKGGGIHHICFRCDDMQRGIDHLKKSGMRLIVPPESGEAFKSNDISFLFGNGGLNIELIDTEEKDKIIGK